MDELRKDYFLDRYVLISPVRSKRPHLVRHEKKKKDSRGSFCIGNEGKTPQELYRYPHTKEWQLRVFYNKYPVVTPGKNPEMKRKGSLVSSGSFGYHEVIVDTPGHDEELWDLPIERIADVLRVYNERIEANMKKRGIKYVSLFKNHGGLAGASLHHSHSQLVAYSQIPEIIKEKEKAIASRDNPYGHLIKGEMDSSRRCFENIHFAAFCPFASRFPYEIVVFPKRHILNATELTEDEIISLAEIMRIILLKLRVVGENYNFYFQNGIKNMRFHIEMMQRKGTLAGFELATDCLINTVRPEDAAKFYRE